MIFKLTLFTAFCCLGIANGFYFNTIRNRLCAPPRRPTRGRFRYVPSGLQGLPSSVVEYTCYKYFTLVGSKVNICSNRRWIYATPRCVPEDKCKRSRCHYRAKCTSTVSYLGSASYKCKCQEGYSGDGKYACYKQCTTPYIPKHGGIRPLKEYYDRFDSIQYYCNDGYVPAYGQSSTVCNSGFFRGSSPVCLKKDCEPPTAPQNGVTAPNRFAWSDGHKVTYSCKTGYHLSGAKTAECQSSGSYYPPKPTCERTTCPTPTAPENGYIVENTTSSWFSGDIMTFGCYESYSMFGSNSTTCGNLGSFDSQPPTCEATIMEVVANEMTTEVTATDPIGRSVDINAQQGSGSGDE